MYEIINVEQGSQEWLDSRAGVITGTRLKQVMSTRKDTREGLIYELIAEQVAPLKPSYQNDCMERGHIVEEIVKEDYPLYTSVGFIKRNGWMGISPDAIMWWMWYSKDSIVITHALEIKAPEAKNFIKYALEGGIPDEYKWQVVMYFIVIDTLQFLDFIIYNPEIRDPRMRKRVITVSRSYLAEDIEKAENALVKFREEWIGTLERLVLLTK